MTELRRGDTTVCLREDGTLLFGQGEALFEQRPETGTVIDAAALCKEGMTWRVCLDGVQARVYLRIDAPGEICMTLSGEGRLDREFYYPGQTAVLPGDTWLLPIGEGMAFPVDDARVQVVPKRRMFMSPSQCMAFVGLTRGSGYLVISPETYADALVDTVYDEEGRLVQRVGWVPEQGEWGEERRLRFLLGNEGGISAACKAYRALWERLHPVRTLRDKARLVPGVERLIGAANIWIWPDRYEELMYSTSAEDIDLKNDRNMIRIAQELRAAGLERALFGLFFAEDSAASAELRSMGYLVTKYDNYADVLPTPIAAKIPEARIRQCDYTARRMKNWPDDVAVTRDGRRAEAWALRGTDGVMYTQNTLCACQAARAAEEEVARYAAEYGCDAWFFDVSGGSLSECHSPKHPVTRRQSVSYKEDMMSCALKAGLVSGTEEGVECLLNGLCYVEGRMSPQQYRINFQESGRRKAHQYLPEEHEALFDEFMLNPIYRVPLFDLVYHDCCVSYWYWGDSSVCCPELTPRRDLFNALYAQPPLYSFHTKDWDGGLKKVILDSMKRAVLPASKVGWSRMLSFEYLTEDKLVQRTVFDNGVSVTANFSEKPFVCGEDTIAPGDYQLQEE